MKGCRCPFPERRPQGVALTTPLPLERTVEPGEQGEVAELLRAAHEDSQAVYPVGGGTSLDYGLPAKRPGLGLGLAKLRRIVDYPARDMTITVEAGLTMQALAETLAAEQQRLPIDVPEPEQATIGGVIATNFGGPRRYGQGTIRDYVIGISAVDGRGRPFKGGGRVVKNVAGYDFCKLLTGSLGTLGVITQVTLKIRPSPERSALVACDLPSFARAEELLAALVHTRTTPAAIELLAGPAWQADPALGDLAPGSVGRLLVGVEGTAAEVSWMVEALRREWTDLGVVDARVVAEDETASLWRRLAEFPADRAAPIVLKANLLPSAVAGFVELARGLDPQASVLAHAGSGIVIVRGGNFPPAKVSSVLVGALQPAAAKAAGNVVVLSSTFAAELTARAVWGLRRESAALMEAVKREFDPRNILNPGRFVCS